MKIRVALLGLAVGVVVGWVLSRGQVRRAVPSILPPSDKPRIERVILLREYGREEYAPQLILRNPETGGFRVYVREGTPPPP